MSTLRRARDSRRAMPHTLVFADLALAQLGVAVMALAAVAVRSV